MRPLAKRHVPHVVAALLLFFVCFSTWELHRASVMHAEMHKVSRHLVHTVEAGEAFGTLIAAANNTQAGDAVGSLIAAAKNTQGKLPAESKKNATLMARKAGGKKRGGATFDPSMFRVNKCFAYPHIDFFGTAVYSGDSNLRATAGECCDSCHEFQPEEKGGMDCNLWAWCGDKEKCEDSFQHCWLKNFANLWTASPTKIGPSVPWTIGTKDSLDMRQAFTDLINKKEFSTYDEAKASANAIVDEIREKQPTPRPYHTITSFQGVTVEWSMRIHYYHFRKMRAHCRQQFGSTCEMGGFTRLLHDVAPDQLMDEIPTVVVAPLPESVVPHEDYVVLNRPYAFMEWLDIETIPEQYLFMSEPDHIFIHPLPNLMRAEVPAAFPFFYVDPMESKSQPHIKRHTGITTIKELQQIPPIGNSPVFMSMIDIRRVMPTWHNITVNVFKDEAANKEWGWIQEMVGFAMAVWLVGIREFDYYKHLMAQPPYDTSYEERANRPFYIIHYTYGLDYDNNGTMLPSTVGQWHFDKRALDLPIPRNMTEPPIQANCSLTRHLIQAFNEATWAFPCWDTYAKTGRISAKCEEAPRGYLSNPGIEG